MQILNMRNETKDLRKCFSRTHELFNWFRVRICSMFIKSCRDSIGLEAWQNSTVFSWWRNCPGNKMDWVEIDVEFQQTGPETVKLQGSTGWCLGFEGWAEWCLLQAFELMKHYVSGVIEHSGKMVILMEIIEQCVALREKILIFRFWFAVTIYHAPKLARRLG